MSNRKGRGTKGAINKVYQDIKECSNGYKKSC